jgi:hypothetical protein
MLLLSSSVLLFNRGYMRRFANPLLNPSFAFDSVKKEVKNIRFFYDLRSGEAKPLLLTEGK